MDGLRDVGLSDRAIHDAAQVIAYFNYITRVAEGLGVEPETFIQPWGAPGGRSPHASEAPGPGGRGEPSAQPDPNGSSSAESAP